MSDKPRVFVSAVSGEFGHTRQAVANILTRLGYEAVLQDIFGLEAGDLRQVLREKIDSCDGLIQLVGQAYGFEPPSPDERFDRVSYTQFEYLYAREKVNEARENRKKPFKTWLILTQPGYASDTALDELDLPLQRDHPDPKGYQAERQLFQQRYREKLKEGRDVFYEVANKTALELRVERLDDKLAALRDRFRTWQRRVTWLQVATILVLVLVAGGVAWTIIRPHWDDPVAKALAAFKPELIREQEEKSIWDADNRDAAEANKIRDPKRRDQALEYVQNVRDQRLARVGDFVDSSKHRIASGEATPEYIKQTLIFQDEGSSAALEYLAHHKSRTLERGRQLLEMGKREARSEWAAQLDGVRLCLDGGDLAQAEKLCKELLDVDKDWPDALHYHVQIALLRGGRALLYENNLASARQWFEAAQASAERLDQSDASNPDWQRDLMISFNNLGDVSRLSNQLDNARGFYKRGKKIADKLANGNRNDPQAQRDLMVSCNFMGKVSMPLGKLDDARGFYEQSQKIAEKLANGNPTDAQAQRDLMVSYNNLGDVSRRAGKLKETYGLYRDGYDMAKKLADADPTNAQKLRDLSESYNNLGDVALDADDLNAAQGFYEEELKIRQRLAAADPNNVSFQRDLMVSYNMLGNVSGKTGHWKAARDFYEPGRVIAKKLADDDPDNAEAQRDLSMSYFHLGDVSRELGQLDKARDFCKKDLGIAKKLADAHPENPEAKRDLSISYSRLGDVCRDADQLDDARGFFEKVRNIRKQLADLNLTDAQAQLDLTVAYLKLAGVFHSVGDLGAALQNLNLANEVIERVPRDLQLTPQSQQVIADLRGQFKLSQQSAIAVGAWDELLKQPADKLPESLILRCELLAPRQDIDRIAQAAEALRNLEPKTPENLYNAARGYGICAKLAAGWTGKGPFPSPNGVADPKAHNLKNRQEYVRTAIEVLQAAVNAGFEDIDLIKRDADLAALRELPEFKKLLTGGTAKSG